MTEAQLDDHSLLQARAIARYCGIDLTEEQERLYCGWRVQMSGVGELPGTDKRKHWEMGDKELLAEVLLTTKDQRGYLAVKNSYPNIFKEAQPSHPQGVNRV